MRLSLSTPFYPAHALGSQALAAWVFSGRSPTLTPSPCLYRSHGRTSQSGAWISKSSTLLNRWDSKHTEHNSTIHTHSEKLKQILDRRQSSARSESPENKPETEPVDCPGWAQFLEDISARDIEIGDSDLDPNLSKFSQDARDDFLKLNIVTGDAHHYHPRMESSRRPTSQRRDHSAPPLPLSSRQFQNAKKRCNLPWRNTTSTPSSPT